MASTGRAQRSRSQAGTNKRKETDDMMEEQHGTKRQTRSSPKGLTPMPEERQEERQEGIVQKVRFLPPSLHLSQQSVFSVSS